MSARGALYAMEPLLMAAFGRPRANLSKLDAVLCHDLLTCLVEGMRFDQFTTRWEGATGLYVVVSASRYMGDHSAAGGVSYSAAAVVLAAARVEEGVWTLATPKGPARASGFPRPLQDTREPLLAAASVLLANGWGEVLRL